MPSFGSAARAAPAPEFDLASLSDEDVYERLCAGEGDALAVLYDRHGRMLQRLAFGVLGDAHESEDVAQDVFVSLWRGNGEWRRAEAKFTTWLYRVTINRAIDRRRRLRAAPYAAEDIAAIFERGGDVSGPSAQDASVDRRDSRGMLWNLLAHLPDVQRRALTLHYFDEASVADMALQMQLSEQAVRALLKRGRAALRARFDKRPSPIRKRNDGR